jgi:tetratricopeptide (TPR) repeat protein
VGQRLGRFELMRRLGSGGMGEVWLARQDGLERHVAVKILLASSRSSSTDRLRREAQALARIRHPHVVPVHDVGEAGEFHYYAMDLVDGRPLDEVIADGRLPWRRAAEIARQIAEALAAAHDQGVIHRDVKPGNVLLAEQRDHATLVDFGIAASELAPTLTGTGDLLGTPYYMAPEQARGEAYLADPRTDVWGLGVTLYEMVTGARPFEGDSVTAVRIAVLDQEPVAPRCRRVGCPRDLETILLHCLDKDPVRRYPSARALADDLARLLAGEPIRARPATPGYRFGKHLRRHGRAWLVGASTAVVATLGLAASVVARRVAQRDHDAHEADQLVRVARGLAERGDTAEAWSRLREVELRFPHTPAVIRAYWAMTELARGHDGDVLGEEVWLERLLDADPPPGDAARAQWRLGRIYDQHGFLGDAREHYARAAASGALAPAELEDAELGLAWTAWLGQRSDAGIAGRVIGAGDVDGDGREEVLVYEPPRGLAVLGLRAGRLAVVRRWDLSELVAQGVSMPPTELSVVDINGDGRPDLVGVVDHCIVADLGGTQPRRVLDIPSCTRIRAGDLDGDGTPELVAWVDGQRSLRLIRVARDWSTRATVLDDLSVDETSVSGLDIADLDGDGRAELIYASTMWTRYDLRVARLDHGALHLIARAQLGAIAGVSALDIDGDGHREIFAVKSHFAPSPRLFDDDPFLGPSGPMVLRLRDGRLERSWFDPLVPASAARHDLDLRVASPHTRLGPVAVVASWGGALRMYIGRRGGDPIRRDVRRMAGADLVDGGMAFVDLAGDGNAALVLGGPRVIAHGIGPEGPEERRAPRRTGADWLSTARELRDAGETELALSAYRTAAAHDADPAVVAFEEGLCHAKAQRWDAALTRFRDAQTAGRRDSVLWRAMLDAAETAADWSTALDAARALGDVARAAELDKLRAIRTTFLQDFVEPWPAWRVEQPLACRGLTRDGALGLSLFPGERALALPIDWDGSSLEISAIVALRDVQYSKGLRVGLSRDDGPPEAAGGLAGLGGGGVLELHTLLCIRGDRCSPQSRGHDVDWSVFPERVRLTLSYVAYLGQWQIALDDLAGHRLQRAVVRTARRPTAGRYLLQVTGHEDSWVLAATIVDLYRFEIRAAPGAVRVVAPTPSDPPRRCARDIAPAGASSPVHRAFALAAAGKLDAAARELAAWRPAAIARPYPLLFELDSYTVSEWEAGLVRLALLDEGIASAVVEAGRLLPRRAWGELLRRLVYQQYVDSGQTHWREGELALHHAIELAPGDAHVWYVLGYCRYRLGDLAAARTAFEQAVALDPTIERRYPKQGGPEILLARIAAREHDAAAATRWLERAARDGGNLDVARHDRALRELLGERLPRILGDG